MSTSKAGKARRSTPSQLAGAAPGASTANAINAWFIQDYGIYQETTQDTRINGRAALQWRPAENLLITVDDNYSRDTLHALQYGYSVWFNAGSLRNVTQNANGTITSFVQPNTPTDFQSQINGSVLQNNDTGVNVKWDATDKLSINLDYDHSQAWRNPGGKLSSIDVDVGYGPSTPGGTNGTSLGITVPGGQTCPIRRAWGPTATAAAFINNGSDRQPCLSHDQPATFRPRAAVQGGNDLDGERPFQASLPAINMSAIMTMRTAATISPTTNGRLMPATVPHPTTMAPMAPPCRRTCSPSPSALPISSMAFGGSNLLPPKVLVFNPYSVLNYLQGLGNPANHRPFPASMSAAAIRPIPGHIPLPTWSAPIPRSSRIPMPAMSTSSPDRGDRPACRSGSIAGLRDEYTRRHHHRPWPAADFADGAALRSHRLPGGLQPDLDSQQDTTTISLCCPTWIWPSASPTTCRSASMPHAP